MSAEAAPLQNQIYDAVDREATKRRSTGLKSPKESHEQKVLVQWLKLNKIRHFAIPNGGSRKYAREGLALKRQGVNAGVPDICIPIPSSGLHGLYIELKRRDGKMTDLSAEQRDWLSYLNSGGYFATAAFGAKHAMEIVTEYLGSENLKQIRYNSNK